jgi:hypothetical protein
MRGMFVQSGDNVSIAWQFLAGTAVEPALD